MSEPVWRRWVESLAVGVIVTGATVYGLQVLTEPTLRILTMVTLALAYIDLILHGLGKDTLIGYSSKSVKALFGYGRDKGDQGD